MSCRLRLGSDGSRLFDFRLFDFRLPDFGPFNFRLLNFRLFNFSLANFGRVDDRRRVDDRSRLRFGLWLDTNLFDRNFFDGRFGLSFNDGRCFLDRDRSFVSDFK